MFLCLLQYNLCISHTLSLQTTGTHFKTPLYDWCVTCSLRCLSNIYTRAQCARQGDFLSLPYPHVLSVATLTNSTSYSYSSSPIPSLVSSPQSVLSEYPNSVTLPHPPRLKQDPSICNPGHATALEALQLRCPPFTTAPSTPMNGPNPPVQTLLPPVPQRLTFHGPSLS